MTEENRADAERPPLQVMAKRDWLGLPGQPFYIAFRPVSTQTATPGNRAYRGSQGKYDVIFLLSRPGERLLPDDRMSNAERLQGNSHLRFRDSSEPPDPAASKFTFEVVVDGRLFEIQEFLNEQGFLGKIEVLNIEAKDVSDAEDIAQRLILPSMSYYSMRFDIPLHIYQVDVVELQTGTIWVTGITPYHAGVANGLRVLALDDELSAYASLYREALNSNSHIYQFLCYYKIIEGVLKRRRRLAAEATARGETFTRPSERLPEDESEQKEWLNEVFGTILPTEDMHVGSFFPAEFRGKRFGTIIEKLRPLRNEVGHAFLDSSEMPLSLDVHANAGKVITLLPMTKCIARRLLNSEFPT